MDDQPIDYEALRERFPWVGLFDEDWGDLASRYREIMAEAAGVTILLVPRVGG